VFDDPNLLPNVGLVPLLALAGRAGLPGLLAGVRPGGPCGANSVAKAVCLAAGMAAGADSIPPACGCRERTLSGLLTCL
jgi:hypothetical protein